MNRLFDLLRIGLTPLCDVNDKKLLDHFLATRDESAFAELVRRYAALVWGVCRRRFTDHDAEDAFQATFLVLLRRANQLGADVPLGPWLHQVAMMTVRNIARGNRRRENVSGALEHDIAAPETTSQLERMVLDEALLSLPERDRVAIVMCHLQGLSRREAAASLGCPEGTLSARLSRALERLRIRLGATPPVLVTAGAMSIPAGLSATVVRLGMIYTTSNLTAAGVSPAVVGITNGVLRMFWMKKAMSALVITAFVASGLLVGLVVRPGSVAGATDPVLLSPLGGEPQAPPTTAEAEKQTIEERLKELTKKAKEIEQDLKKVTAEKAKLEQAQREKLEAAELNGSLDIVCRGQGGDHPLYTVREVINGKVGEMSCKDLDILMTYLTRAFNDPKGPKNLIVHAKSNVTEEQSKAVLFACARAGYTKATFFKSVQTAASAAIHETASRQLLTYSYSVPLEQYDSKGSEIDLTKVQNPKKQ